MSTKERNEKIYQEWHDTELGGRVYHLTVLGRHGWSAKYCKEVDSSERTTRFWQEIYNEDGKLVEVHQKFPTDTGHQKLN